MDLLEESKQIGYDKVKTKERRQNNNVKSIGELRYRRKLSELNALTYNLNRGEFKYILNYIHEC